MPDLSSNIEALNEAVSRLYRLGHYGEALTVAGQLSSLIRKSQGDVHPDYATSLNNLAALYQAMGDYTKAEPLYRQATQIHHRVLGEGHPDYATSLNNLAALYQAIGDYARAEPLYRQALEICRRVLGEGHHEFAASLNNLAGLLVALDRPTDALLLMTQATFIEDRLIGQIFTIGSDSQRMAFLRTLGGNRDALLSLVLLHFAASAEAVGAALDLVLRRKALDAEVIATRRDSNCGKYSHLRGQLDQLAALGQEIARLSWTGPGTEGHEAHRSRLARLEARKGQIEQALAAQVPEMNLEQQLRAADRRAVALQLPSGAALVEFVRCDIFDFIARLARGEKSWGPACYLAFVLKGGEPESVRLLDLGDSADIDRLIAGFRNSFAGVDERGIASSSRDEKRNHDSFALWGNRLRQRIFDPLVDAIGDARSLLLAPDGELARVPFGVLPDKVGHLVETYSISYVVSGRDILRFGLASQHTPNLPVVIAAPDFDYGSESRLTLDKPFDAVRGTSHDGDMAALGFSPLPSAHREGNEIADLLKAALGTEVTHWQDNAALESRLKAVRSPWLLHVATHGFFLRDQRSEMLALMRHTGHHPPGRLLENPMLRSGLALASANWKAKGFTPPPEAEDGLLTAEDVAGLDLLNTELVVLSACDTGLGDVHTGEGVFGLRRAFVLAGAHTLVMSLWKVPDEATRELMRDFYTRILQGEPRGEALRQAQLTLKAKYKDPYYWGAFILQGDAGPLRSRPDALSAS